MIHDAAWLSARKWGEFLLLQALVVSLMSQSHPTVGLSFNRVTEEIGLSTTSSNWPVFQRKGGFVWIASDNGLNRFDGRQVKVYSADPRKPYALRSPFAPTSDFVHNGDKLWFGNYETLVAYDDYYDRFVHHRLWLPGGDTLSGDYNRLFVDSLRQLLWVGLGEEIYTTPLCHPGEAELRIPRYAGVYSEMGFSSTGSVYYFKVRSEKQYLELYRFEVTLADKFEYEKLYTPDESIISAVAYYRDSLLLVGTTKGVLIYDLKEERWQKEYLWRLEEAGGRIQRLRQTEEGLIIIATVKSGVYLFDGSTKNVVARIKRKAEGRLEEITQDLEDLYILPGNTLWVLDKSHGISYASLNKVKFNQNFLSGQLGEEYRGGVVRDNGALCLLTSTTVVEHRTSLINHFELGVSGIGTEQPTFITEDSRGRIWVGTLSVLLMRARSAKSFREFNPFPEGGREPPGYNALVELPNGDLVIGTNNGAAIRLAADLSEVREMDSRLSRIYALDLFDRLLFMGREDGTLFLLRDSLMLDSVVLGAAATGFTELAEKNSFIVSSFNGLHQVKVRDGKLIAGLVSGFPEKSIKSMVADKSGGLWLGTSRGLYKYNIDGTYRRYTSKDGLPTNKFVPKAAFKDRRGEQFFCSTNGVIKFRPEEVKSRVLPATPKVTELIINGRKKAPSASAPLRVDYLDDLSLPYDQRDLGIRLSALEYSAPEDCRFRYAINDGHGMDTVGLGRENTVRFGRLSPGTYRLGINAANSDGEWSTIWYRMRVRVARPWYATNLALATYVCLFFLLGFNAYRIRAKRFLRAEKLRTKAAMAEAKVAETETAVLRLQMNPHFIANGLNAVNRYIIGKDLRKANKYLSAFAGLTREILERSEERYTRLDEEIELLEDYLLAEQLRLDGALAYSIEEDADLDTCGFQLPTMIVQPFVENAIWHGLSGLNGPRRITLRFGFTPARNQLLVEIEDNGRGRSATHAKRRAGKRISSLEITRRRLALLNEPQLKKDKRQDLDPLAEMKIRDKFKPDGTAAGTHVMLYLPLIKP